MDDKTRPAGRGTDEPEIELFLAVVRQARRDLLEGSRFLQVDAEKFFRFLGVDPERVRASWGGPSPPEGGGPPDPGGRG